MMNATRRFQKEVLCESGSAAVITALLLGVLLLFTAFVMDLGVYYSDISKLQNALDSAALAAACELPASNTASGNWADAVNEAIAYASLNGFALTADEIQPVYQNDCTLNRIIGITVTKTIVVEYNFARVLGIDSGTATRTASAGLSPVGGITGAIPLCITASSLRYAITAGVVNHLTIKCSTSSYSIGIDCFGVNGWFGALRFEDNGASEYADLLAAGYDKALYVGQVLDMENGNMSGPTMDGFTVRFSQCKDGCTAESFKPDCPRLCYLPVVQVLSSSQVKIVSFAVFFLESCGGSGTNSYIKATYIDDLVLSNAATGTDGQDFGLYERKLFD